MVTSVYVSFFIILAERCISNEKWDRCYWIHQHAFNNRMHLHSWIKKHFHGLRMITRNAGEIGEMMTDNGLSENINRCVPFEIHLKNDDENVHKFQSGYCFNPHFQFTACRMLCTRQTTCWNPCLFVCLFSFITSSPRNIHWKYKMKSFYKRRSYG